MKALYIKTFGCQMNDHDSAKIAQLLHQDGYTLVQEPEHADLILVNTCSVREKAENKALSMLGRARKFKRKNPNLIIGIGGCVAQQEAERLLDRMPYLDLVFGTDRIPELPEMIYEISLKKSRVCNTKFDSDDKTGFLSTVDLAPKATLSANITVMKGCNNYCSYCIVPYVRGREKSRPYNDIIDEIKLLVEAGFKEVTLLGQNVNSYGIDNKSSLRFPELLEKINNISGLYRIRFTTSHPKDLNTQLMYAIRDLNKVCEQIHLPLQAGSNSVLKKMNRGYTCEEYLEKLSNLREIVPDIALSGDMIVGFPGESEEDFEKTMSVLDKVRYDWLFSFKYSPRKGTNASKLVDTVTRDVKQKRLYALQSFQDRVTAEKNMELKDSKKEILVEGFSRKNSEQIQGRTRCNRIVNLDVIKDLKQEIGVGSLISVYIKEALKHSLIGTLKS